MSKIVLEIELTNEEIVALDANIDIRIISTKFMPDPDGTAAHKINVAYRDREKNKVPIVIWVEKEDLSPENANEYRESDKFDSLVGKAFRETQASLPVTRPLEVDDEFYDSEEVIWKVERIYENGDSLNSLVSLRDTYSRGTMKTYLGMKRTDGSIISEPV